MTESQLRDILKALDAALEVYRKQGGKLTAREISLKSMLTAARMQIEEQLAREFSAKDH